MITYTLKENNEDPKQAVIEKSGFVQELTLSEYDQARTYNEQKVKEITAKCEFEKAKVANIIEHHPFVLDISAKDLLTTHMYAQSSKIVRECEKTLKEFEEITKELDEEEKEILNQLPQLNG